MSVRSSPVINPHSNQKLQATIDLFTVLNVGVKHTNAARRQSLDHDNHKNGVHKTPTQIRAPKALPGSPGKQTVVQTPQVYGNAEKIGIRAAFAAAARCGSLVYLDDTGADIDASATGYFLKNGYIADELHPINFSAKQCLALSSRFEVNCLNMDMGTYLQTLPAKSVGGVWIDLMGYTVSYALVIAAMSASKYVVTLTFTSAHAPSARVDTPCKSVPFTDQYGRKVLQEIKKLRLSQTGELIESVWQCTSFQVYGAATNKRELNMINMQFQRKEDLTTSLCTFDVLRPQKRQLGRIITNVFHDDLYSAFEKQHTISEQSWLTVLSYIVPKAKLGVFFEETETTALGWYVGTVVNINSKRYSVDEWSLNVNVEFEGEGVYLISLHPAYYMTTPHEPGRSWVLLDDN